MANYIVLRLLPPETTDPSEFVTYYLTGLTVKVYDISYNDPTSGMLLGSASFAANHIVQHSSPPLPGSPATYSVATALIHYTPLGPEYDGSPDLRIEFDRPGATPLFAPRSYYNVALYSTPGPFPGPNAIQTIPDENVSAFVTLPSSTGLLTTPTDSTPPTFTALDAAVRAVLTADPGGPPTDDVIADLSIDQCRNIANELAYQHADPLPAPPPTLLPQPEPMDSLQDMYTYPTNNGQVRTSSKEQNRQQFEGALAAYYGPLDALALRLTNYIFALSTAYWCRRETANATSALVTFPVDPNGAPSQLTTEPEAQIMFTGALGIDVPAQYFYALTYNQSIQTDKTSAQQKQSRQQLIAGTDQQTNLQAISQAADAGWIAVLLAMNPAQAARIIEALNIPPNPSAVSWNVSNPSPGLIWSDWQSFPSNATWKTYQEGDDDTKFWQPEELAQPAAFLDLVLYALTQGYQVGANFLYQGIAQHLLGAPLTSVAAVSNATPANWQTLFQTTLPATWGTTPDAVLPLFTVPGTASARIAAFIAYVQKFFQLGETGVSTAAGAAAGPPRFHVPSQEADLIYKTIQAYAGFTLGTPLNRATLEAAAAVAAPGDVAAQAWAVQAIWTLNDLYTVSQVPGGTPALDGAIMEALFARGFTSIESILDLPVDDFQQALTGTVAYDEAGAIYNIADGGVPPVFPVPVKGPFGPINPGGLTNCIPPLYLSPLGPVAYLNEMLRTSERSTCDHPFAPPAAGHSTLQGPIDSRRGPVETLAVTRANLDTALPVIDMANECLEYMASTSPPTLHGKIYQTSEKFLAGYKICDAHCDEDGEHHDCGCEPAECGCHPDTRGDRDCHEPRRLFDALPEYSTPATPVTANSAVEPAVWDKLKSEIFGCCLPYNQPLDVNRTYLEHFDSCRFETMRTFRRCITEFVLDPTHQPTDFQTHLWRYPIRLDIAIEYLGLSPEEFTKLFGGIMPGPCVARETDRRPQLPTHATVPGTSALSVVAGCEVEDDPHHHSGGISVPHFLKCSCLSYCELVGLWKCGFIPFDNGNDRQGKFPECEPCCLEELWLRFPGSNPHAELERLYVFVRLWLKLRRRCGAGYSFTELADICTVLGFSHHDFIRQLASFQMLRDQFRLKLTGGEPPAQGATGADRTYLLSLFVGPNAAHWSWAIHHLLEGIAYHARCRHECEARAPEFIKLLASNLDSLSRLAGFDPSVPKDTWWHAPTHALRFAEILAKIYASRFTIGEVLFLFTANIHLDGEDPFPLQDVNQAEDEPLGLPEEADEHSLRHLRHKLLKTEVPEEEVERSSWSGIEAVLTRDFGFNAAAVNRFGAHFFAEILEASGHPVAVTARRFNGSLGSTNSNMWNSVPDGPFRYDTGTHELWAVLPIADEKVFEQLKGVQSLDSAERQAVQDVYFRPRAILSQFSCLFDNLSAAERHLIEERDAHERWRYFKRQFVRARSRCRIICEHLSRHVEAITGQPCPRDGDLAQLVLKHLFADENAATPPPTPPNWESDDGTLPNVTWRSPGNGGAFAALLGLIGTGLDGRFTTGSGTLAWREVRESTHPFGMVRDREGCPVPTVIPAMGLTLTPAQMKYVTVRNGFALADTKGRWLGGAQAFEGSWRGALFVDHAGEYHFRAGAPLSDEPHSAGHRSSARHRSWRVVLKRGQKTWILLRHHWHGEEDLDAATLSLHGGAYEIEIELLQHAPEYLHEDELIPAHTGFEIRYRGPDTHEHLEPIPGTHLFRTHDDGPMVVAPLTGGPADFLHDNYRGSLRNIRRTYQRAFKALLFAHRFELSSHALHRGESELGYMLSEHSLFAGRSYYRTGGVFTTHKADFNLNLLPVGDDYFEPKIAADDRAHPSLKRIQALFDWWERIFDYCRARAEVRAHCERHLWLLFAEARDQKPVDPSSLLRHLGADSRHWFADLHYFQDQTAPIYAVTTVDLMDDRWTVRALHADLWLRRLQCHFTVKDIEKARPDLWASTDPQHLVPGQTQTGNANLLKFLCDGCIDNGPPRRYEDIRRLSDGLRERGRDALICYLCGPAKVAKSATELSDLLLLDVLAGRCEKASRIEDAISAVQTFVRRARLGLEPTWSVTSVFARLWDCRFISYRIWQTCKRRELYKENSIEWQELEKAGKVAAFGLLEEQLKRATLTVAEPTGADYWPSRRTPDHPQLCLMQQRDPAEAKLLNEMREGLDFLAAPERAARPSWITTVPEYAPRQPNPSKVRNFPLWMECAIRMGTRFVRIAAAAYPAAATHYAPWHECREHPKPGKKSGKECCVTCCEECGCEHPAHIDEYYFWLLDARHFTPEALAAYSGVFDGQQNEYYDHNQQYATPWHDPSGTPSPFPWPSSPLVRLAWCRVHNGEFQQPRRSEWGVAYDEGSSVPDLAFEGRVGDSLYFSLTNPSTAGFRYDMVLDAARELTTFAVPAAPSSPPPTAPLPPPAALPGTLVAYPYFLYSHPGDRLFPWSIYSPAVSVARSLRTRCRFEAALKWYELAYNPLDNDNRWALCEEAASVPGKPTPVDQTCCCDTTDVTCRDARHRSILLDYLDTLREWGDALLRVNSPEAFQQARTLFDIMRKIMGRHPRMVKNHAHPHPPMTVATFKPLWAPINPRLVTLYDQLDDRLTIIHKCMSARRLVEAPRRNEAQYWADDPVRYGWRTLLHGCCETDGSCRPCRPYRFEFRIQKAKEWAGQVRELGAALLAAFEKGDAEFLSSVHARQESELAHLNLRCRKDEWSDSDWQVQALEKSKQSLQSSRRYYAGLIAAGLNADENGYVAMLGQSMGERTAANVSEGVAEAMDMIPDIFCGEDNFIQIPVGTKLAGLFKTIARITNTLADIAGTTAQLDLTEGGWDRRRQDWVHQVEVLDIQIEQTELQILGAERRRDHALRDLNVQQRTIEQVTETLDLLRDKFTNHAVYLYLQKHTADLYRQFYELALREAHECELAFNCERGHTAREFIERNAWSSLHEGLLAGERLSLDLARMEKEYYDHNCREYELTKHISLRLCFPLEFLRLKLTGRCEIELPEWLFDLDYPGQYMRRIKTVSLTIPCVSGPFNEVHCRLTLLRSGTRIDPLPTVPAARCCDCCQSHNGYPICPHDPRWVSENGALEAIATSSGVNDAGLFQLNFNDARYLPFEYHGAVSRWRIELPKENNYFEMDSLSDVILNMSYTSREGGEALRRAARKATDCDLPGAGWCLFDLRQDFADAWELFHRENDDRHHPDHRERDHGRHGSHEREDHCDDHARRRLVLRFERNMFPFVPGHRELHIETMVVLFDRPTHCGCECPAECPCCRSLACAQQELILKPHRSDERRFLCVADEHWPHLYHGVVPDLCIGPVGEGRRREQVTIYFPHTTGEIDRAYLLCRYTLQDRCCEKPARERPVRPEGKREKPGPAHEPAGLPRL